MKQLPKTLVEPLPILQVVPVERHRLKLQGMLPTPVYVTAQRRNAMGNIRLKTSTEDLKMQPCVFILLWTLTILTSMLLL